MQVVTTIRKDMGAVIIWMAEVVTTSPLKQKAFPKHGRLFILVP